MYLSKLFCASALTVVLSATPALAAFTGPTGPDGSGVSGGSAAINTAAQVANAPDDTPCLLEGYIVERVRGHNDKYTFKDATGIVVVEIDDDLFRGRDIGPADKVRLSGEVDTKTFRDNQVDVDWLEVITPAPAQTTAAGAAASPRKKAPASASVTKAAQIAGARDKTPCLLEGHITQRVKAHGDRYLFKDDSGTVTVDIDKDQLRNRTVTPQTRVRLSGKVDMKHNRPTEVDVDWLEILN